MTFVDIASRISHSVVDASNWRQDSAPALQRAPVADGVGRMFEAARLAAAAAAAAAGAASGATGGERELVATETSVDAGGKRDAYDLHLYREPDGTYTLELHMKIEFNFVDGTDGLNWTPEEKQAFMDGFVHEVEDAWSGHSFTTDDGMEVTLEVHLDVSEQESGFFGRIRDFLDPSEHYNVNVLRIPEGDFHRSSVGPGNVGNFDSEDNRAINKGASMPQVASSHEFGHMIGLPDEYHPGHVHESDTDSIMHSGMEVRDRHLDIVGEWVENNS